MGRYICDLETNGLLPEVSVIHCAVTKDIDTGEVRGYRPHEIGEFLELYQTADLLVFHNGISYDCKVIEKLHGITIPKERIRDTLILGRLVHPDIKQSDFERSRRWREYLKATETGEPWDQPVPREFPAKLIGRHSLEAWGYRMGNHKGDYSGGWETFNEDMFSYMLTDAEVTYDLWNALMKHEPTEQSVWLEHRVAWLCDKITANGFPFNVSAATELYGRLVDEREDLRRQLIDVFPSWRIRLPDFVPKRPNKTKGYEAGVPVERWKDVEFNPLSRAHIIDRLIDKYQWKPALFTQEAYTDEVTKEKVQPGSPKMDEEVLLSLPYPEAKLLGRLFLINKRIGQLAEGNQAWLKVQKEGKIHASYNTNGAVTGRATHSRPNISQVPRVSSEFGRECRSLFHVPPGWKLVGADQSGLELRCLASDMAAFDKGAYGHVVTQGDVHSTNQLAAGLSTRDQAKTFIYAFLYGAGPDKIGSIAGGGAALGKKLRSKFLSQTPALKKLIDAVKSAAERGWIKGIDGRKMPIRSTHAALNTRLQNSGALTCKQWGCDWEDALLDQGLKHGWDGDFAFVSWSHDEYQVAVRDDPAVIETVEQAAVTSGRNAGNPFNFKCPLDVGVKVGMNWAETH